MASPCQKVLWITLAITVSISLVEWSSGLRYRVGDSVWSIPPSPNFYSDWSFSTVFYVGDSLVFEFEWEFFNVIQVTRQDYDSCTSWSPTKILTESPAIVLLSEEGVFYYICNISNYCDLGQKITIIVHKHSATPSPAPLLPLLAPEPTLAEGQPGNMSHSPVPSSAMAPSPVIVNVNFNSSRSSAGNKRNLGFISYGMIYLMCLGVLFILILASGD